MLYSIFSSFQKPLEIPLHNKLIQLYMAESKKILYLFMLAMLFFGTANTIVGKAMDLSSARGEIFNHPYFQTAGMFAGEFLCLIYYWLYMKFGEAEATKEPLKPKAAARPNRSCTEKMGKFVFIIPSFFDFCASFFVVPAFPPR